MFGAWIFIPGTICPVIRLVHSAYQFAGVTFAIVTLVVRTSARWIIVIHRLIEVSPGIAVALVLAAILREHEPTNNFIIANVRGLV